MWMILGSTGFLPRPNRSPTCQYLALLTGVWALYYVFERRIVLKQT